MRTIEEFCNLHHACSEGREWALANCKDMQEVWSTARPDWVVWIATRAGVLTDNELRRFAISRARSVEQRLTDERSRHAIDVAGKFLDGEASAEELEAASARASASAARAAASASAAADAEWLRANTNPTF